MPKFRIPSAGKKVVAQRVGTAASDVVKAWTAAMIVAGQAARERTRVNADRSRWPRAGMRSESLLRYVRHRTRREVESSSWVNYDEGRRSVGRRG